MSKGETKVIPLASDEQKLKNKLIDIRNYVEKETRDLRNQGVVFEGGFFNQRVPDPSNPQQQVVRSSSFWVEATFKEGDFTKRVATKS